MSRFWPSAPRRARDKYVEYKTLFKQPRKKAAQISISERFFLKKIELYIVIKVDLRSLAVLINVWKGEGA
jgi:hypothetical protein